MLLKGQSSASWNILIVFPATSPHSWMFLDRGILHTNSLWKSLELCIPAPHLKHIGPMFSDSLSSAIFLSGYSHVALRSIRSDAWWIGLIVAFLVTWFAFHLSVFGLVLFRSVSVRVPAVLSIDLRS